MGLLTAMEDSYFEVAIILKEASKTAKYGVQVPTITQKQASNSKEHGKIRPYRKANTQMIWKDLRYQKVCHPYLKYDSLSKFL